MVSSATNVLLAGMVMRVTVVVVCGGDDNEGNGGGCVWQ